VKSLTAVKIINYLLFQIGWLACVWGAAEGYPWMGLVAIVPTLLLHFRWAHNRSAEARLLLVCALTGIAFDGILLTTGWVAFPNGEWIPGLAPYWMMVLWVFLGTTLNLSMAWMKGRPVAAFILGAVGGPLAYIAGEKLGGITLVESTPALIALAVGWGVVMPALAHVATRLNGFKNPSPPDFIISESDNSRISQHG